MPRSATTTTRAKTTPPSPEHTLSLSDRVRSFVRSAGQTIDPKLKTLSFTPLLVFFLVVGAYFIGYLQNDNENLKKQIAAQEAGPQVAPAVAPTQPEAPQPPAGPLPPVSENDHVRGNRQAKVYLVEYADYECPFCKSFHPAMTQVAQEYGDQIAWVYRHYPLPFHANAQKQAEGSECVAELGGNEAFWKYTDLLYERTTSNGTGFAIEKLGPLAAEIGVNQTAFQTCLDSNKYAQKVQDEMAAGTAAGVSGTPNTFLLVNGSATVKPLQGAVPYTTLKQSIDDALKQ